MAEIKYELTPTEELSELIKTGKITSGKVTKNDFGGYRIPFERHFPDGTKGPVMFVGPDCFSYGVNENNQKDGTLSGYSMCAVLHDSKGPTKEQMEFTTLWKDIYKFGCDAVVKNKMEIKQPTIKKDTVAGKVKDPVYRTYLDKQDEEGNALLDESKPPRLYLKLDTTWENLKEDEEVRTTTKVFTKKVKNPKTGEEEEKKTKKKMVIVSKFWDNEGNDIQAFSLKNRNCNIQPCISLEGLYVSGQGISFQIKVNEGEVRMHAARTGVSLMKRPTPKSAAKVPQTGDHDDITIVVKTADAKETDGESNPEPNPEPEEAKKDVSADELLEDD